MRIVFDTNVLFSAFVAHGVCSGLYEECLLTEEIVVSGEIADELREKLISKATLREAEAGEVVRAVTCDADLATIDFPILPVCRDPDDDMVLATAASGNADAIVTGDQDLLVLKQYRGIPILSPRDCLVLIRRDSGIS